MDPHKAIYAQSIHFFSIVISFVCGGVYSERTGWPQAAVDAEKYINTYK